MSDNEEPKVYLTGQVYDRLKFLAQVLLPGLAAAYFSLAGLWGLPKADEIVGTITIIDTFLGLLLAASSRRYKKSDARFDGQVSIRDNEEEGTSEVGFSVDPDALTTKDEVTLKVKDISRELGEGE